VRSAEARRTAEFYSQKLYTMPYSMLLMKSEKLSPLILRLAVGLPFFLLGIDQLLHPQQWIGYLALWAENLLGVEPLQFFFVNGFFDTVLGLLLILGIFTRVCAVIAALHLTGVILNLGYNEIAIRDLGILLAAVVLALTKKVPYSLDSRRK